GRTRAPVGVALVDEELGVLAVDAEALALPVRAVRAADVGPLVPRDAEPAERVEDGPLALLGGARLVRVLDAQQELPAALLREGVVEQRDVARADVRVTGRRRRDADDGRGAHVSTPWQRAAPRG